MRAAKQRAARPIRHQLLGEPGHLERAQVQRRHLGQDLPVHAGHLQQHVTGRTALLEARPEPPKHDPQRELPAKRRSTPARHPQAIPVPALRLQPTGRPNPQTPRTQPNGHPLLEPPYQVRRPARADPNHRQHHLLPRHIPQRRRRNPGPSRRRTLPQHVNRLNQQLQPPVLRPKPLALHRRVSTRRAGHVQLPEHAPPPATHRLSAAKSSLCEKVQLEPRPAQRPVEGRLQGFAQAEPAEAGNAIPCVCAAHPVQDVQRREPASRLAGHREAADCRLYGGVGLLPVAAE